MNKFLWFWGAFLLFFAVPFPCMLYFSTSFPVPLADRATPWWALGLLAISVGLWLTLLYAYLDKLLLAPPRALERVRDILASGTPRNARIEHAQQTGVQVRGFAQWKLRLAFDNLSGTPITDELIVVDSQPALQRFQKDRRLDVRISTDPGRFPNLAVAAAQPAVDKGSVWRRALAGVVLLALVGTAYTAAWRVQHEGMGWTFLSFGHPLLVCPLVLCGYLLGLRLLARIVHADAAGERLKYRGIAQLANVVRVRQTGTYLNEQPQVEFTLSFDDAEGRTHQVSLRRFVSLIDLPNIPRERMDILYDPQDPQKVRAVDA